MPVLNLEPSLLNARAAQGGAGSLGGLRFVRCLERGPLTEVWHAEGPDGSPRQVKYVYGFDRRDGEDVEHVGTYLEIERPRRLVFTFGVPKYSKLFTRVSIDLEPLPTGCVMTLTQEGTYRPFDEGDQIGEGQRLHRGRRQRPREQRSSRHPGASERASAFE